MRPQESEGHCFLGGVGRGAIALCAMAVSVGDQFSARHCSQRRREGRIHFKLVDVCRGRNDLLKKYIIFLDLKKSFVLLFLEEGISQINIYLIVCSIKMEAMRREKCRIHINAMIWVGSWFTVKTYNYTMPYVMQCTFKHIFFCSSYYPSKYILIRPFPN